MMNKSYTTSKKYIITVCIFTFGIMIIAMGAFIANFKEQEISNSIGDWSSFGAYVGGVLGFISSLVSITLIYLTYKSQAEMSYKMKFEASFFELLGKQRDIYNENKEFKVLCTMIENHFITEFGTFDETKENQIKIIHYYYNFHDSENNFNLHYFRLLHQIFKYTHNDKILSEEEKRKYIDIVQAGMSDDELRLTFYNVIWYSKELNDYEYLGWLDLYSFFENMQSQGRWFDSLKSNLFIKTKWKHNYPKTGELNTDSDEFNKDLVDLGPTDDESYHDALKRFGLET
ncbi:MAG: putative phage abortive infection protein [Bacteroidales bacterium]|nr:putative phage abortive infection protein [Bacteroidales bacterium]